MIDTVRYKINASPEALNKIRDHSTEFSGYDHDIKKYNFQIYRCSVPIGSYSYKINIMLSDLDYFFLEFSVPKFIGGNNIYLYHPEDLLGDLDVIKDHIEKLFRIRIPEPLWWILERLDLCYAWKFFDDITCQRVLEYLKHQSYPRRSAFPFLTSVMWKGDDETLKFYMKAPEFYAHDFKKINKDSPEAANNLLDLARGVLRFEITLRKAAIISEFGLRNMEFNIASMLTEPAIYRILSTKLHKLIPVSETMDISTAYDRIMAPANTPARRRRAFQVYSFYRMYHSSDPLDRSACLGFSTTTQWRYKRIFRRLRLGIPSSVADNRVSLSIPSDYAVGFFPARSNTGRTFHR